MGIEILTDKDTNQIVMFCNTSEMAFGPVFGEDEDPWEFLNWLNTEESLLQHDVTKLMPHVLSSFVDDWRKQVEENEAEAAGERHFTEPGAWSGGFARNH